VFADRIVAISRLVKAGGYAASFRTSDLISGARMRSFEQCSCGKMRAAVE
jgi:hypothetical protein